MEEGEMGKRLYFVCLQVGECLSAANYNVVAPSAQWAIAKSISKAVRDTGRKTGWRCIKLEERTSPVIA